MQSLLRLLLLTQKRDPCFQYIAPFLSFWFRIGQNRASGAIQREKGKTIPRRDFPLRLIQQLASAASPRFQQKTLWQPLALPTTGRGPPLPQRNMAETPCSMTPSCLCPQRHTKRRVMTSQLSGTQLTLPCTPKI